MQETEPTTNTPRLYPDRFYDQNGRMLDGLHDAIVFETNAEVCLDDLGLFDGQVSVGGVIRRVGGMMGRPRTPEMEREAIIRRADRILGFSATE